MDRPALWASLLSALCVFGPAAAAPSLADTAQTATCMSGPPLLPDSAAALRRARVIARRFDHATPDDSYWSKTMIARDHALDDGLRLLQQKHVADLTLGAWEVGPINPWSADTHNLPAFGSGLIIAKCDGALIGFVNYRESPAVTSSDPLAPNPDDDNR